MAYSLVDFKLRLETMVVRTDFESIELEIATNLTFYSKAIKETMKSESLEHFLRLVLRLGNFMNTVSTRIQFDFHVITVFMNNKPYWKSAAQYLLEKEMCKEYEIDWFKICFPNEILLTTPIRPKNKSIG